MSQSLSRVVLDTVVYVQALISGRGASAGCVERLKAGRFVVLLSNALLAEMRDVPLRPELTRKYPHLTPQRVEGFVNEIESLALSIPVPASAFSLTRDPKDEPLIDLAVAGDADYLVTWNERHLTYLMKQDTAEGRDFCARFPKLRIVSPPDFLKLVDAPRVTP
ncbi:MAG: pilt protein domain protein [Phycisphaerales bacterium]|nr:pilt protein domain protein [Phycisphaerales bacterium]